MKKTTRAFFILMVTSISLNVTSAFLFLIGAFGGGHAPDRFFTPYMVINFPLAAILKSAGWLTNYFGFFAISILTTFLHAIIIGSILACLNRRRSRVLALVIGTSIVSNLSIGLRVDAEADKTLHLSLSHLSWVLEVNAEGFVIKDDQLRQDGKGRKVLAVNESKGLGMSVFLEAAPVKGDSKVCREYYWSKLQKSPLKMEEVKMSERGDMAIAESLVKEIEGIPFNQKHLNAYIAKDNVWIDIHLSKIKFRPEDEALFNTILESVKFKEKKNEKNEKNGVKSRHDYI